MTKQEMATALVKENYGHMSVYRRYRAKGYTEKVAVDKTIAWFVRNRKKDYLKNAMWIILGVEV